MLNTTAASTPADATWKLDLRIEPSHQRRPAHESGARLPETALAASQADAPRSRPVERSACWTAAPWSSPSRTATAARSPPRFHLGKLLDFGHERLSHDSLPTCASAPNQRPANVLHYRISTRDERSPRTEAERDWIIVLAERYEIHINRFSH